MLNFTKNPFNNIDTKINTKFKIKTDVEKVEDIRKRMNNDYLKNNYNNVSNDYLRTINSYKNIKKD